MGFRPEHFRPKPGKVFGGEGCGQHTKSGPRTCMAQELVGNTGSQVCPRPAESEHVFEQDAQVIPALVRTGEALI